MTTPPDNYCPRCKGTGKVLDPTDQNEHPCPECFYRSQRQIAALLNDKPTAAEFEAVCTSNHQLERELAQLRHEGGIKDGRIAEIGVAKEDAINRLAEQMHRADELQKRLSEIAVTALTIDGESASNYDELLKAKARIAELEGAMERIEFKAVPISDPLEVEGGTIKASWNCLDAIRGIARQALNPNTNACLLKEESK